MTYFKVKILTFFAISSLFIMPIYADQSALSKEELEKQIKVKEERFKVLNKEMSELESSLASIIPKIKSLSETFMENKKNQLLKKNPKLKNALEEAKNAYLAETLRLRKAFDNASNTMKLQIAESSFFEEGLSETEALLLKFYFIKMAYDQIQLKGHLIEWEAIINEAVALVTQLKSV